MAIEEIRTPEEHWEILLRVFPPGIPTEKLAAFRTTFFAGMTAMLSLMAEVYRLPIPLPEKEAIVQKFKAYISQNNGLVKG